MNRDPIRRIPHLTSRTTVRGSANVRNIRPSRGGVYDANAEERNLCLDGYQWSLILIVLRDAGLQVAADLADTIESRLKHPSSLT